MNIQPSSNKHETCTKPSLIQAPCSEEGNGREMTVLWRQTRLGQSGGVLCLTRPPSLPPGETATSQLPDEILAIIFSYVPPSHEPHGVWNPIILSVPYVCKRWCRVYEAVLYSAIYPSEAWYKDPHGVSRLLNNLSRHPARGSYVREVSFTLWRPKAVTWKRAYSLLSCCKRIRSASLHADLTADALPLIELLATHPLQRLNLSGQCSGPGLRMLIDYFSLSTLQHLYLSRYGVTTGQLAAEWRRSIVVPISQDFLDQVLPPYRLYTSPLTSMILNDPSTPSEVTAHLLRWPSRLERLTLTGLNHSVYQEDYTLPAVQRMLDVQCKSLKRIDLGIFRGGAPDVSAFPCLEWLSISMLQLQDTEPATVFMKLAAPRLRVLRMSFSPEYQHSESHTDFAQSEVDWFSDFAACKTKNSAATASHLETILVVFKPNIGSWLGIELLDCPWPWDYLEEAARRVSEHKITLTYGEPACTRQDWHELMECARAEA